jgi:hypothetical protein
MNIKPMNAMQVIAIAVMLLPSSLMADVVIYETANSGTTLTGTGNYVPFTDDGTALRPSGAFIGNAITFDAAAWAANDNLDSVVILPGTDTGASNFTMYLFSGNNPTSGSFLGSSTTAVGHSAPSATFTFDLVVPQTVTFIVSSDNPGVAATCTSRGTCAGVITSPASSPVVGTTTNEVWFGTVSGSAFSGTENNTWAITDGDQTNTFAAEFLASATPVPTPDGGTTLALLGIAVAGLAGLRRKLSR